jgi:hypothetical protein
MGKLDHPSDTSCPGFSEGTFDFGCDFRNSKNNTFFAFSGRIAHYSGYS